jgi:AmpE protein
MLRARVQALNPDQPTPGPLYPLLLLCLPPVLLIVLLLAVESVLLGSVTLLIHVGVLLVLFDRVSLRVFTEAYLNRWRSGDFEAAFLLQERWGQLLLDSSGDRDAVHEQFCRYIVSSSFERLFAVVFWYLVLGPAAALLYHLTVLYRLRGVLDHESDAGRLVLRLGYLLEWVPARLLALTFSLAGDFVASFAKLRELLLDSDRSAVSLVLACALAAAGTAQRTMFVKESAQGDSVDTVLIESEESGGTALAAVRSAQQAEDLLALLQRSQVIWVTLLAVLAVYGAGG